MPLVYRNAVGEEIRLGFEDRTEADVVVWVAGLQGRVPALAARKLGLKVGTRRLNALSILAGVAVDVLKPLTRVSSGVYTEDDYLGQFDDESEKEEYGDHAGAVVRANLAAWQDSASLERALAAASRVLRDSSHRQLLFADLPDALELLLDVKRCLKVAIADRAAAVCIELDDAE